MGPGDSARVERYSGNVTSEFVYLDHAATTPMRAEAIEAMLPYLDEQFANPSGSHRFSRLARRALDEARDTIAGIIGCRAGEIVFTGCGSESDNAAISGIVRRRGGVAVCPASEHHAVLHCVEHHAGRVVGVDATGVVDFDHLAQALDDEVSSVAVMAVNNEVGSVSDLQAVAQLVRQRAPRATVHTDAVQAACWLDLRTLWPHVDTMALSAHKFGGPKGVGILAVRDGVELEPLIHGGGQERDRRSGTHNLAGIVATAVALQITDAHRETEAARIDALRRRLLDVLTDLEDVHVTVPLEASVPGVVHVCIGGVESEALLYLLDEAGVCASAASACASGALESSHVLAAMGVGRDLAAGALRVSLGHTTTSADIDAAATAISQGVSRLRSMSTRPKVAR